MATNLNYYILLKGYLEARPLHARALWELPLPCALTLTFGRGNHVPSSSRQSSRNCQHSLRFGENVGKEGGGERSELRFCTRRGLHHAGRITCKCSSDPELGRALKWRGYFWPGQDYTLLHRYLMCAFPRIGSPWRSKTKRCTRVSSPIK